MGVNSSRLITILYLGPDVRHPPEAIDTVGFVFPRMEDLVCPLAEAKKKSIEQLGANWQAAQLEDIVKQADERLVSRVDAPGLDSTPKSHESAGEVGDGGAGERALEELLEILLRLLPLRLTLKELTEVRWKKEKP